jgi:hypothetical protein
LIKELGIGNSPDIYPKTLEKEDKILDSHYYVLCKHSFVFPPKDEELDLPPLYRIPKLPMSVHKQCFIAVGSTKHFSN